MNDTSMLSWWQFGRAAWSKERSYVFTFWAAGLCLALAAALTVALFDYLLAPLAFGVVGGILYIGSLLFFEAELTRRVFVMYGPPGKRYLAEERWWRSDFRSLDPHEMWDQDGEKVPWFYAEHFEQDGQAFIRRTPINPFIKPTVFDDSEDADELITSADLLGVPAAMRASKAILKFRERTGQELLEMGGMALIIGIAFVAIFMGVNRIVDADRTPTVETGRPESAANERTSGAREIVLR